MRVDSCCRSTKSISKAHPSVPDALWVLRPKYKSLRVPLELFKPVLSFCLLLRTMASPDFDPNNVNLTSADPAQVVCFLQLGQNEYNGGLGSRVSALFVILFVSTACTLFPVVTKKSKRFKIPLYVYLFARYFG